MGRRRQHASDLNQKVIVSMLRKCGFEVHIIDRPVDLLVGYAGRWVLLEVKNVSGKNQLTPGQRRFFEDIPKGPAFVVTTFDEAYRAVKNLEPVASPP